MSTHAATAPAPAVRSGLLERARRRPAALALVGFGLLAVTLVLGLALGTVAVPIGDTIAIIAHRFGWPAAATWADSAETIIFDLRLPRVLTAMAVGVGLSLAGATYQGLLRNPLADPYVLGTASGAALGAAIALIIPIQFALLGLGLLHLFAFGGALAAVAVVYRVARLGAGGGSMTSVLLTGYAVGSLLAAALTMAMYVSGNTLRQIFNYMLGSFATASWPELFAALPLIAIGSVVILTRARALNALLLGESTAAHLGLDVGRERLVLLVAATVVTAAAVAVSGLIGFVGLVVPHVVRLVVGPNARALLPLSAIYGAIFLALADLIARIPGELPVGVVTAIVGAPFFVYLLRHYHAGYEL